MLLCQWVCTKKKNGGVAFLCSQYSVLLSKMSSTCKRPRSVTPLGASSNDLTGAKTLEKLSELRISAEEEDRPIEVVRMMEMELYTQLKATAAVALAGRDSLQWWERWRDTSLLSATPLTSSRIFAMRSSVGP